MAVGKEKQMVEAVDEEVQALATNGEKLDDAPEEQNVHG